MTFKVNQKIASCGGTLMKLSHQSKQTKTNMDVNVYLPKQYFSKQTNSIPVIYYLSGLTCSPQNASEKAFWQFQADKYGFAMVFPDTSPRGDGVPEDPEKSWDFGLGAGFYVDAKQEPFKENYQMFSYIHKELPLELNQFFNNEGETAVDFMDNIAITGHSMGGFGAISGFLKHYADNKYKSCSAFAPIAHPSKVKWGEKAFGGYLGEDRADWDQYDPSTLIKTVTNRGTDRILIHQGTSDPFYKNQLRPELLLEAAKGTSWDKMIDVRLVDGFDHSYYFVSSFVPEHAEFHAKNLGLI